MGTRVVFICSVTVSTFAGKLTKKKGVKEEDDDAPGTGCGWDICLGGQNDR